MQAFIVYPLTGLLKNFIRLKFMKISTKEKHTNMQSDMKALKLLKLYRPERMCKQKIHFEYNPCLNVAVSQTNMFTTPSKQIIMLQPVSIKNCCVATEV